MSRDVVVVGAGIIGTSIAWRLAQRGVRVSLFDSGRMGGEASWAGAGMLAPGGEIEAPSAWAELALASLRLYSEFVQELEEESGLEIDYQRRGAVEAAFTETECAELDRRAEAQQSLGIPSSRIAPGDVPVLAPGLEGARFFPEDALVNPRDVIAALRKACIRRGVEIREGVAVHELESAGGTARVRGGRECASVVLAAGAWSSQIGVSVDGQPVELPRAFPVRGHLIGYRCEPRAEFPIVRHGKTYVLQRSTGFTIAGTSSEQVGFDRSLDAAIAGSIGERAGRLVPGLQALPPSDFWIGFRPGIEGEVPAIGRLGSSHVWLAYGHYRNGILLAPVTADRVSSALLSSLETGWSALPGSMQ
jgi:glycine oxidase